MTDRRTGAPIRSWQTKETVAFWLFLIATLLLTYLTIAFSQPGIIGIIGNNTTILIALEETAGAFALIGGVFLAWSVFSKSGKKDYDFRDLCSHDSRKMFFLLLFSMTTGLLAAIVMPLAFSSYLGAELLTTISITSAPLPALISGPIIGALLILGSILGFIIYSKRDNLAAIQPAPNSLDPRDGFARNIIAEAAQPSLGSIRNTAISNSSEDPDQFIQTNITEQDGKIDAAIEAVNSFQPTMTPEAKHNAYANHLATATAALQTMQDARKDPVLTSQSQLARQTLETQITQAEQKVANLKNMANNFPKPVADSTSFASSSQASSLASDALPSSTASQPSNTSSHCVIL